jgi:hypothetical protein
MTHKEGDRGETDDEFLQRVSSALGADSSGEFNSQEIPFAKRVRDEFFKKYLAKHFFIRRKGPIIQDASLVLPTFYGFRQESLSAAPSPSRVSIIKSLSLLDFSDYVSEQIVQVRSDLQEKMPGTKEHRIADARLRAYEHVTACVGLAIDRSTIMKN